ncbi:hypothetical protein B7494_g653 [Chlorociboria aeruginascens]|nr:hypothetical protein B7494_g653 [Chlorociboria aeruginascens]
MSSTAAKPIFFGPFEVTDQVFYSNALCYGLVNIKPILPGHVLIIPHRAVPRLTDLTPPEITSIFSTVQKVQRMLASRYFAASASAAAANPLTQGSFNVAIQDGPESGQTVPHVHCHIIPRPRGDTVGDEIYDRLQSEEGNVGGGLWDLERPKQAGKFPNIEEDDRKPRSKEEMNKEADMLREKMKEFEADGA